MNKRIKAKHMKKILINNLNIIHYAERKLIDQCDTCTEKEERSGWSCCNECDPEWKVTYLFKCQDLIKLIKDIYGIDFNTYEFNGYENIPKYMNMMKYYLMENKINGFSVSFYDAELGNDKDYLQVIKYKFKKRKINK